MSGPPEPRPDPVAAALRMRASDADRERVAGLLRDAYADGRLSPVEHEERLADVYRAATYGERRARAARPAGAARDPCSAGRCRRRRGGGERLLPRDPTGTAGAVVLAPDQAGQGETSVVAIFGGFERKGRWILAPKLNATCIFGGGDLDLTEVVLTSQETEIQVVCVFGGIDIIVPDGIAVRVESAAIFGGSDAPRTAAPPGAPLASHHRRSRVRWHRREAPEAGTALTAAAPRRRIGSGQPALSKLIDGVAPELGQRGARS